MNSLLLVQLALGSLVAGLLDTVAGFGGALLLLPVLVMVAGERDAVVLSAFGSLGWSITRVVLLRPLINWRAVALVGAGMIPGVALGTVLFGTIPEATLRTAIGVIVLLFGLYYIARLYFELPRLPHLGQVWMVVVGVASGVIATLLGAGHGPLNAAVMDAAGMSAREVAATGGALGGIASAARAAGYVLTGTLDAELLLPGVICAAGGWLGAVLGVRFSRRSGDSTIELVIGLVLLLAGVRLLL